MIIRGWHIDGFGVFHDRRTEALGSGLTVLHGPNEAGKSTLLAFIRGVLFGFPDKRSKGKQPLYPPVHGGQHGGRLFVEHDGETFTIARSASSRKNAARIRDADGKERPEGELMRLLGGADRTLFQNVFGFSLWELQELDSLTAESVRDRIFSGAIAGAGRDARAAADELEKAARGLYRPDGRAKNHRMLDLLQEVRDIDDALAEARQAARAYPDKLQAESEAQRAVEELRSELESKRARKATLERLLRLWGAWTDREAALAELETAKGARFPRTQPVEVDPALTDLQRRADQLRESLELQRQRLEERAARADALAQAEASLARALDKLGSDWTVERVEAFRMTIPERETIRAWEHDRDEARTGVTKAEEQHAAATKRLKEAQDQQQKLQDELDAETDPPPDLTTLRAREDALERLRAELSDLANRRRDAEAKRKAADDRAARVTDLETQQGGRLLSVVALGLVALGIVAAAGGVALGLSYLGSGAGAVLGALGVAVFAGQRRGGQRHAERLDEARKAHADAVDEAEAAEASRARYESQARASAADQGFDGVPAEAERVQAVSALRESLEHRRRLDAKARELADATQAVEARQHEADATQRALDEARRARDDLEARWTAWKRDRGFPAHLTPQGVRDFAQEVEAAQRALAEKQQAERSLDQVRAAIDGWESAARIILAERARDSDAEGEALIRAFNATADAISAEQAAYARIAVAEQAIHREAGHDPARAAELRATLADGDVEAWRNELGQLEAELADLQQRHESGVAQQQAAKSDREAVERSERIAELETRRNQVADEIRQTHRRWQELTTARALVEETLEQFERERQPTVFANASERLAFFTRGRYVQIRQDPDGQGFTVMDSEQNAVAPIDLSRGTREQLYLAVRLGLIEEFMGRGTTLPLVMDEILVNFDPERMAAVARELGRFAEDHQVLLFTCHPEIAERVQAQAPGSTAIAMSELSRESIA
jgi:uncharacterized protein YhaN